MTQRGYFDLPTTGKEVQTLHFSSNCWYNLLEDTGKELDVFGKDLQDAFASENPNNLQLLDLLTDLAYAAAKAYDQEEGNEMAYNRFKIRHWVNNMDETTILEFANVMSGSIGNGKK